MIVPSTILIIIIIIIIIIKRTIYLETLLGNFRRSPDDGSIALPNNTEHYFGKA